MDRRSFLGTTVALGGGLCLSKAASAGPSPAKALSPNTQWLREAKWGAFSHFLVHMPSAPVPADMTAERWNGWVDGFDTQALAEQFSSVGVPYFFLTIGQGGGYYCSPNETYERRFGPSAGKLSHRDLVADLAAALHAKGIRQCVYFPGMARKEPELQPAWQSVLREWSLRWGKLVSAWWVDGSYSQPEEFKGFADAIRAGNPDVLIAFNTGPVGMNRNQLMPATEYEDYLAGEVDYFLPTCGVRVFDQKKYYLGPDIAGDQLHFLNFLGAWWSTGDPRFSPELATSWTRHINDHGGTVTWDLPLSRTGRVSDAYMEQLAALQKLRTA